MGCFSREPGSSTGERMVLESKTWAPCAPCLLDSQQRWEIHMHVIMDPTSSVLYLSGCRIQTTSVQTHRTPTQHCLPPSLTFSHSEVANLFSQRSCSVLSDSLGPYGQQQVRLPCPSPAPGACSNSVPLSR